MKKRPFIWIILLFLASIVPTKAQNMLVINDVDGFLNEAVETALKNRLAGDSIELTSVLDMRRRCEYWIASLALKNNELTVTVTGCNDVVAGTKNIGSRIMQATDDDKAMLLYFALSEIFANPYKAGDTPIPVRQADMPTEPDQQPSTTSRLAPDPDQHRSRYFFAPSSYNLDPGELYYNTQIGRAHV